MATVQKKPRRLPKLPAKDQEEDEKREAKRASRGRELPAGRKRELPPLRRGGRKGEMDTKSLVDMGRKSPVEYNNRTSLTATNSAKSCYFYIDNDYTFPPMKMVIHPKKYKRLDTVTRDLSTRMKTLPFGVRSIFTPRGQHRIHNLEDLTQEGHYICSSNRKFAKGMDVARVGPRQVWHHMRPDSGRKNLNHLLKDVDLRSGRHRGGFRPGYDLANVYSRVPPKKTTVMKNGEPDIKHMVLLNRRTAQTFEQVLKTLSDLFQFAVRKLYTMEGMPIDGLQKMLSGPDAVVAAGHEPFINLSMGYRGPQRNRSRMSTGMGSSLNLQNRMQTRKNRMAQTKGRWQVTLRTNALPSAGTQAQVTITVYGHKGNSGPITLGHGDGSNFQPGQVDDFTISVGNVGEIYKIRLAHDNSGDFPGWLCDEVNMKDMDTQEDLSFSCRRWLARDEDDQEITRELAVKQPGEPILPLIKYQVDVYTGDMWGGGTDANVYMTIYGDRGDTGVRQLYAETKGVYFKQGQMDTFEVEAVSLGHLKRLIVGHDGTGPGAGWYLDKVVIREPPFRTSQECVFHCGKWLDEGEDDGKIVRELRVQDEYMDDILEKRNWEYEKWKYEKDCQVVLFSVMTGKALRLNRDLAVDGIGEEKDKYAVFNVIPKKPMKPMFASVANANHYLAIDNGRITGLGKGGPYCEFRVRAQQDRTTLFESVKNPLQFLTIGADGVPGEVRGILDKDPSRRFHVYAKGCFRHKGIIMLGTSLLQSVNVNRDDMTLTGRGKRGGPQSQFKVHKVNSGGIRMFESVAHPGKYMRLKDGKIDCNVLEEGGRGEEAQFLVLRHKDKGYITLQSASQRGLFVGMTADGRVHTTIDTGVRNIWLYPEVIEWGIPKQESTEQVEEIAMATARREASPVRQPTPTPSPEPPAKQFAEDGNKSEADSIEVEEEPAKDGDWSIHVSSITELKDGDVALVAYGDKGNSGPIVLGAPPGRKIFQDGNEDEFRANLLKIGHMFKIRLELVPKSSTKDPSWQVKEVRMQDLNSNETLKFDFTRWLSRNEDDGEIMRELPVQRPGVNALPVLHYIVSVYTGKEMGAETDAPVYITVHGEKGDWGKRYLLHSNNNNKFRTGQVDVFYIEAVSLGDLQRCVIGHDGTGAGEGWYLEQVVIKEDEHSPDEFVFPCNRWLDSSMEDRKIERALMVKVPLPSKTPVVALLPQIEEESSTFISTAGKNTPHEVVDAATDRVAEEKTEEETQEETTEEGQYEIEIVTGPESDELSGGKVHITLYGDKGTSTQEDLYATQPDKKAFEPGNIDKFTLPKGDYGELYKIRIGRDDNDKWNRWFLAEVRLIDSASQKKAVLPFNRWLSRDMDDGDMCREQPVVHDGKPIPVLFQYQVQIVTGDHWGASTDANIYVTLSGSQGDGGKRLCYKSKNNRVKFQRGQTDKFTFEIVDLKQLKELTLSHDGRGHGAGVFIEKVIVTLMENDQGHLQNVFPCGRWLDTHEDDCVTERTLRMIDIIDSNKPPAAKEGKKSNGSWMVKVRTSAIEKSSTSSNVNLSVYGTNGHTDRLPIVGTFDEDTETECQIQTGDIGRLTKIRLSHDSTGSKPEWRVDYVKMTDNDTGEELVFYLDRWLSMDREDGAAYREMPVVRKGTPSLPVLRYVVAITTGSYKDAGFENGSVSINLIGVNGDTGFREMYGAISKNRSPWQPGQTDIFMLEAVSVGKIKKIEVNFDSPNQERWYVQQVSVGEGARSPSVFVCYCHQWLLSSQAQHAEFPLTAVAPSTQLVEMLESIPKGLEKPVKSKGRWLVLASTGSQTDAGTKEKVAIVLCGLTGESQPVCMNSKEELNPNSIRKLEVKTTDIGLLFKVRLVFMDKHEGSSWYLAKMKLKDQDTGEEFMLEHNDWIESTNENPEGAVEIPLTRPDIAPLKEQIYIVSVKTGDLMRAETDAHVFCNLIGQWGSSGRRSLAVSSNDNMFRAGQLDSFTITCVDLGDLEKVIIGHDSPGRGQGWFCEQVVVKVAEHDETIFPCNRWLDTGCADRKLSVELRPLTKLPFTYYLPTRYTQSDGEWNIHVTTAGVDKLSTLKPGDKAGDVSIVVYGTESVKGPIELTNMDEDSPVPVLMPGKTQHYFNIDLSGIGEIEKVRVSSGYEGDTQAVWTIDKVVLEDLTSHEALTFDYQGWVGEVGGDIRKELPLVKKDTPHRPVVKYFIEVHTSEEEMNASTDANIFVTLYGDHSDSGRRHLIHSKTTDKRFQSGQVDRFELEAVDLGDLTKLVVAKGPGKPWLLEKIIVKKGEFDSEEHIFMFGGWIGDKSRLKDEIEETLKPTATIPSHVAIPFDQATDLGHSAGSWEIETITGGRRGPDGPLDVVVVISGTLGETAPLPLHTTRDSPFQIGQEDRFQIQFKEKIGEIRKVRLGFVDQSVTKALFIRKITFNDSDTHDTFWVELNDWMAVDNKLDGWKEFPVPWPAIALQPVLQYRVTVSVGQVNPDSADNQVYVCLYGDQGSTGRRLLKYSQSNTEKFREKQVDVYEVEAVCLGELVKLVIGHGNTTPGGGWFLERISVQENPDADKTMFLCNKWLDAGEGDNQIERTLFPSDAADDNANNNADNVQAEEPVPIVTSQPDREPTPERETTPERVETPPEREATPPEREKSPEREATPVKTPEAPLEEEMVKSPSPAPPEGTTYTVTTVTGGEARQGTSQAVQVIIYGDKAHSKAYLIGEEEDFRFNMDSTDTFKIHVTEDVGKLYKVRLGFHDEQNHPEWCEDLEDTPSWYLDKFSLKNEADGSVYEFESGLWVKANTYQDFWRELPVKQLDTLEVYQYHVTVYTGDESKAGTDAVVYLQIFGECGDTGYRRLMSSKTNLNKFEQGQSDVFELGAVDLGKLTHIKIRHDGSGPGSGWLLDRVVIKETEDTTIRYVFRYERWLDEGDGDSGIEQTLALSEILVSDEAETREEDLPGFPWTVVTVTDSDDKAGTSHPIELVLYQTDGQHEGFVIGERKDFQFEAGATDTFNVRIMGDISDLYKVRLGYHGVEPEIDWYQNYDQAPSWCAKQVTLTNEGKNKVFTIDTPTWLKMDTYTDFWREQPILQADGSLPVVFSYVVEVYTGNQSKAGSDANVELCIHGNKGDTGLRRLMASKTNTNKFEQGSCDVFEIEAVDLGDLSKVKVRHDGAGIGSGWYLDKVVVMETAESTSQFVFNCDNWLDVADDEAFVSMEIPLTEVIEKGQEPEQPGLPWIVWLETGEGGSEDSNFAVEMVLYGDKGHSLPVILGAEQGFHFIKEQKETFEVRVEGDVGHLYKVRVGFHGDQESDWLNDYQLAPIWALDNLRLKDVTCDIEYELDGGAMVQVRKHTDFWRELPVRQGQNTLEVHSYQMEVYTGEQFKAGTDANVSVQLYGERGDTGMRRLMDSKTNADKFEGGEKDVFEIPAVDLGKLTKVKVTHDGAGPGSGWLLEKIAVRESPDADSTYEFGCGRWLDEGTGDLDVEVTLTLTDIVKDVQPELTEKEPSNYKDGDWKAYVKTSEDSDSGTDSNVTITVYGDADNTGPIPLGSYSTGYFYSGKTDEFDLFLDPEAIGQIRKIRLEHDNSGKPWQVDEVVLVNKTDGTRLEFPINKWLTLESPGFDIAVEVPVSGKEWPVRDYVVSTLTGDGFGSGTDARVYINLIGTIGDSGKRFLVHNVDEGSLFESGEMNTFVVQAVDLGRLMQVQIGHDGSGPGSGWFLKTVTVKESADNKESYVFKCEQWLHDEKEDGATERMLMLDHVDKGAAPTIPQVVTTEPDDEEEDTHVPTDSNKATPVNDKPDLEPDTGEIEKPGTPVSEHDATDTQQDLGEGETGGTGNGYKENEEGFEPDGNTEFEDDVEPDGRRKGSPGVDSQTRDSPEVPDQNGRAQSREQNSRAQSKHQDSRVQSRADVHADSTGDNDENHGDKIENADNKNEGSEDNEEPLPVLNTPGGQELHETENFEDGRKTGVSGEGEVQPATGASKPVSREGTGSRKPESRPGTRGRPGSRQRTRTSLTNEQE